MVYLKRFLFALSCLGFLILPVSAMQPAPSSSPPQGAGNFDRVGVVCLAAPFEVTNDTQLDAFLCDVIAGELEARLDGRVRRYFDIPEAFVPAGEERGTNQGTKR